MPTIAGALSRRAQQGGTELSPRESVARRQTNLLARGLAVDPNNAELLGLLERYGPEMDREQLLALGAPAPEEEDEGGGGILGSIGRVINSIPGAPQVLDILDRPSQAVLQGIENIREGVGDGDVLGTLTGSARGLLSGLSGRGERVTATDAIFGEGRGPGGFAGGALDFAGSVATDPTTYLTFGTSGLARSTLGSLAREGAAEGLQGAAQAIGRRGLRGAVSAGEANLDDITGFLSRQAASGGSRNVEKAVNRQIRHLNRSGAGGVRFAGMTLPGTRGVQSAIHPLRRTSVLDEPAQTAARRFQGARDFGDKTFRTTGQSGRRFGSFVAGDVAQARTAGHAAAERAAQAWAPAIQKIALEIPQMTDVDNLIREGLQGSTQTADEASVAAGSLGATHADQLGLFDTAVAKAPAEVRPEVAKVVSGLRAQYDDMARTGREIGYEVPDLSKLLDDAAEEGKTAAEALLGQATRIAATTGFQTTLSRLDGIVDNLGQRLVFDEEGFKALDATARPALEKIKSGNMSVYAPKEIAEDIKQVMDYLTTDEGLRQLTSALNRANSLWKAYATVLPVGGGFFARNETGNILASLSAGMNIKSLGRAAKIQHKVRKLGPEALDAADRRVWDLAQQEGITEAGFIFQEASPTLSNVRKAAQKGGKGQLGRIAQKANPLNIENFALKAGRSFNTTLENNSRLALFADGLEKGMSPSAAAQRTKKYLFDYSDLTAIEREKIKPWVAFYTYMRNNVPLQANMLVTKPGVLTGQVHAAQGMQQAVGEGTPTLFPSYPFEDSAAIASPGGIFSLDTPLASAAGQTAGAFNAVRDIVLKRDPQAAMQFVLNQTSGIRPALSETFMEVALERDLFTGQDLDTAPERVDQVVDAMFPGVRKTRRSVEQLGGALTGGERAALLPFFLGIGYVPINDSTQLGEMYNRLGQIEDVINGMGEIPTIEELRDLGIMPGGSSRPSLRDRLSG